MKGRLKFILEASKLKKKPRSGFLWLGIKNPETIAQHSFRVAILNWILARKIRPKINLEKIIKISLAHDLCEVYAGDITPYWGLLPKDPKKRKEVLKRWIRLPKKIKEKRDAIKLKKEKKAIYKLVRSLEPRLQKEIINAWLDYERFGSSEGRFVRQGDKVETLFQAIEYWGSKPDSPVVGWWEEVEDLVDEPVLKDFLEKIEQKFYKRKKADGEIKFISEVGRLKSQPRTGWVLRGVKNPETIAEHGFILALIVWLLGGKINREKGLKMALIHEICEIYAKDKTPYHYFCPKEKRELREILRRWPRSSRKKKISRFLKDCRQEQRSFMKILKELPLDLKREILYLWDDFKKRKSREGRFVNQAYWVSTFIQAAQYWKKDKKFPIKAWGEQLLEFIDDPDLLDLFSEINRKFKLKLK